MFASICRFKTSEIRWPAHDLPAVCFWFGTALDLLRAAD
jgi:hypothetical protein